MRIAESELILRPDGSIYHLGLKPEQMCTDIITVGDPNRVAKVSKHFDTFEFTVENREIVTHKGTYKGKPIMVISTGMGTDNIDIVLNELDALVNIDFQTREPKSEITSLNFYRIGTSGALQPSIETGSFLISKFGIGLDGLLHFYNSKAVRNLDWEKALQENLPLNSAMASPYVVKGSDEIFSNFLSNGFVEGNTLTLNGFYGPQGRVLRLPLSSPTLNDALATFEFEKEKITNLEMETAGIYGLSAMMGHQAISCNLILANRANGTFLTDYSCKMDEMIKLVLDLI